MTTKKKVLRVILYKLILYAGLIYGGLCLLIFLFQTKLIFPSSPLMNLDPGAYGWTFDEVKRDVQGETTYGWFVPLENARGVALFSHGNAGNLSGRLESIALLRSLGFSVLAYDYGGYGYSTGSSSEKRCYADIRSMWDYLIKEKKIPPAQILLFGRSLGGAVNADLAKDVTPAATILESTFRSAREMGKETIPYIPLAWVIRHHFATQDKVADIDSPLLIVHSRDDDIIPFLHGQQLFEKATQPKTFLEISGDHNYGFVASKEIYLKGWNDFLDPLLPWSNAATPTQD